MAANNSIKVSVGLPAYNRGQQIRRAIESVLAQTHTNLELIISDDASSDDTQQVCEEYAAKDTRVRYIRQPHNLGLTANWNAVLRAAETDYFMWLSDDDWLDKRYIQRCLAYLQAHEDYAVVSGMTRFYVGDEFVFDGEAVQAVQPTAAARVIHWYRHVIHAGMVYGLFRRAALRNGFPDTPLLAEDQYIVAAACCAGKAATLEDTYLFRSREGTSGTTAGIMRLYGVKPMNDFWLQCYKGRCAARDICRNPAYDVVPAMRRRILALQAFHLLWFRFTGVRLANTWRRMMHPVKHGRIGNIVRSMRSVRQR